ncbi:hypothetical protein [Naasia sp. SYSU D00948]|uniref:hypothetical protein n=1 Tax=Naasia sp. SYSU D00948 TaxID=2817379 RepID=UPI001B3179C2|nr:hypothetical protein [Naasia sp. SYSU D00948]
MNELSEGAARATQDEVRKAMQIEDGMAFLKDDSFTADPSVALGQVFVTRRGSSKSSPFVFPVDVTVKPSTVLKAPLVRGEIVVDRQASAGLDVLSLANLDLSGKDVAELRIIDNYSSRVDTGPAWRTAIQEWEDFPEAQEILADPDVRKISVVVGVVQKYITVKRYTEFSGEAKVNAYGINVEGKLFTSTSAFRLEIIYGLSLVDLRRGGAGTKTAIESEDTADAVTLGAVDSWARSMKRPVAALARTRRVPG